MGSDWLKAWVNPMVWVNPTRWDEMYDLTGKTARQEHRRREEEKNQKIRKPENPAGDLSQQQRQVTNADSSEKARQMLISGDPQRLVASSGLSGNTSSDSSAQRLLVASSGLSGNTSSGSSARRKLLGA